MLVKQSHVCLPVNEFILEIPFIQCIPPVPTSLEIRIAAFKFRSMDNHFGLYYEFVTVVMYCMYCSMARETLLLQNCNCVSDCSVQCAYGTRNSEVAIEQYC